MQVFLFIIFILFFLHILIIVQRDIFYRGRDVEGVLDVSKKKRGETVSALTLLFSNTLDMLNLLLTAMSALL